MRIFCLIIFISFATGVYSQDTIKVTEVQRTFSKGNHNAFDVVIPQAKQKDVTSDWKKFIRQKSKSTFEEVKGEYVLSKSVIADITKDSLIIYSIIRINPGEVELISFITGNDSSFYSSASIPDLGTSIKNFIRNFAVNEYRNAVSGELADDQKKLKQLENDLDDLDHENDKLGKKITANERENDRTQNEIKSNLQQQDLKSTSILTEQQTLATFITPSDEKSAEEKKLKDLEKDKKKLEKQNESLHKNIEDNDSENKSTQKKIDKNNSDNIPTLKAEISKQKELIASVEGKLKGIK